MDKKLWDAWLEFSSEAMKGAEQARKAFESMSVAPFGPDDLSKWMSQWYPKGAASTDELTEVVEAWWSAMGGVPRHRYEEVLKQNRELWERLKESEATISKLREFMVRDAAKKTSEQAEIVLDEWEKTTREVMEAQAEIARKWSEELFGVKKDQEK
jgi:hypothetical protein